MNSQPKHPPAHHDYQVILLVAPEDSATAAAVRQELSDNSLIRCEQVASLADIWPVVDRILPDLILIAADEPGVSGDNVLNFCREFRGKPLKYRPVLVVRSSAGEEKRIEFLMQGADDVISGELSLDELAVRILVHLRRNLDFITNEVTRLAGLPFVAKVFQRRANREAPWALLVIEIAYFDYYVDAYGQLAGNQVLRTLGAMLQQYALVPDCIGHTEDNQFLILTHPDKAEKIAAILCRQFETAAPNFYSARDRKQGYMVSVSSRKASRRVPLLSLAIGIAGSTAMRTDQFMGAYHVAMDMKALARMTPGSHWQSLRPKLAGEKAPASGESERRHVLVVESDAALAFLLKTTLEMQGYDVEAASGEADAEQALGERPAQLVILDSLLHGEPAGLSLSRRVREKYPDTAILCVSSLHNREEVLSAGADLYLPKPFELMSLFAWIEKLLKGD